MSARALSDTDSSRSSARWGLALLALAAAAIYLWGIDWGLPPDSYTWAGDEIRPVAVTDPAQWDPLYPPAHRHFLAALFRGLAGAGRIVSWQPEDLLTFQTLAARGLTVLLALLSLLAMYRTGRLVLGRVESLLAVACVGFGAGFVFSAKMANLDVPYLCWFVVSLVFYLRCLRSRRIVDYVLFAAFGTLSIATKTQAWALYLLPSAALVLDLRRAQPGQKKSIARALFDRRVLAAAGATLFVTLLLFGALWGRRELLTHYHAITGMSYEDYRAVAATPPIVLEVSLENLVLSLGTPVLVLSLLGIVFALLRPKRNAHLLHLLLFPLSYYPAFILATGFNYERHYLPITVVLGLFAGKAMGAIWRSRTGPLWLRAGVIGAVVVHIVLRGVSVDLVLRGDARYETERWLADEGLYDKTVGLGSMRDLPRGLTTISVKPFARWRRGEHATNPVVWHNCAALRSLQAEYLIPDFPEKLTGPGVNYSEHRRFHNRAPWSVIDFGRFSTYHTTLAKISRDSVVFKRTDAECVDSGIVPTALHELRFESDPERRLSLARAILQSPGSNARPLSGSDYVVARTHPSYWTLGTVPAGVVVRNSGRTPYAPKLTLSVVGAEASFPIRVWVEDGTSTREILFERPDARTVELRAVEPGGIELFIVWTDKDWLGLGGRLLGVRITAGETRGEWLNRLFDQRADPALYESLSSLASSGSRQERARFAQSVLDGGIEASFTVEAGGARLVGGWPDGWTYGTRPAGLVIENPTDHAARPRLRLACELTEGEPPLSLSIEDGVKAEKVTLDCRSLVSVRLRRLGAGAKRLYILRPDRPSAATPEDGRLRGVQVRNVRLIEKKRRS